MRVLFTLQPADGHLNPMLGLSAALRHAGHEVVWATSASYVPRVEARGERAIAAGVDWLESDGPIEPPAPDADPDGHHDGFERFFLRRVAADMASDLVDLIGDLQPDVVVRETTEFGGSAAAEVTATPCATFDLTFPIDYEVMCTIGFIEDATPLEDLRRHLGLTPAADPDWFRGQLIINTLPQGYRTRPLTDPHVVIRPNGLDVVDDAAVPAWVAGLDGAIYVTLGTVFTGTYPHVLDIAATGAAATGRDTVVTYGRSVQPEDLNPPPGRHVRVEQYVPQGPVLDRCAAAVVHGGTGTTLGAVARGLPVVVIPLGADQFDHAEAITNAGAGVQLDHEGLTPDAVHAAVAQVLSDPAYAAAARALAEDFAALPPPDAAIPALEALAAG